jgi:hypothetical protein
MTYLNQKAEQPVEKNNIRRISMYAAIKAIYENGQIIFQEEPPTNEKQTLLLCS